MVRCYLVYSYITPGILDGGDLGEYKEGTELLGMLRWLDSLIHLGVRVPRAIRTVRI